MKTVKVCELPIGARFSCVGQTAVYVLTEPFGCGGCVEWKGPYANRTFNGAYSVAETQSEFMSMEVLLREPDAHPDDKDGLIDHQVALSRALAAELEDSLDEIEQLKRRLNTVEAYAPIAGIEWKAQGDANDYVLLRGNQWIAHVLMNGELTVSAQEKILNSMLEDHSTAYGEGVCDGEDKAIEELQAYKAKVSEVFNRVASYCAGSEVEFLIDQALVELNGQAGGAQ